MSMKGSGRRTLRLVAWAATCSLLALGFSAHRGLVLAQPAPSTPSPATPPQVDPKLWKQAPLAGLGPQRGYGLVKEPSGAIQVFSLERAIVKAPPGLTRQKLRETLAQARTSARDSFDLTAVPESVIPPVPSKAPRATRAVPLHRPKPSPRVLPPRDEFYPVGIPARAGDASLRDASKAIPDLKGLVFDSVESLDQMTRILQLQDVGLMPDFIALPAGIIVNDESMSEAHDGWPPGSDVYWSRSVHDLWRAWQLSQVAKPVKAMDIWVAVVDQGFGRSTTGLVWDKALPNAAALDAPPEPASVRWHGAMCGSALNATVGDGYGAAGSALLGSGAQISRLVDRSIRTLAVVVPRSGWADLARGITDAVRAGANIVSVSYSGPCDALCQRTSGSTIPTAVAEANRAGVLVLFAAGNQNRNLDAPGVNYLGCETTDAICVGALDRQPIRWELTDRSFGSNYGEALSFFGPGCHVWLNPDPGSSVPYQAHGTSLATPFVAGMLALVQSSWGQTFNRQQLEQYLNESGARFTGLDTTVKNRMFDVYKLMRRSTPTTLRRVDAPPPSKTNELPLMADSREPNETVAAANQVAALSDDDELLSLHSATDRDVLRISSSQCEQVRVSVDYLQDDERGTVTVAFQPGAGVLQATPAQYAPSLISLSANLCTGDHYLNVSASDGFTTGYTVRLTRSPLACAPQCGPPAKGGSASAP